LSPIRSAAAFSLVVVLTSLKARNCSAHQEFHGSTPALNDVPQMDYFSIPSLILLPLDISKRLFIDTTVSKTDSIKWYTREEAI
jgi:hypothetical protein